VRRNGAPPREAAAPAAHAPSALRKILLVGNPNVGKSVLFQALTGTYAIVSNYPGTTVEVSKGTWTDPGGTDREVLDTPGLYSLRTITDEERVSRDLIIANEGLILHVVDAKNLPRMLPLTLELAMLGRPMILVCNLMDEAERAGVRIDLERLTRNLGIPVLGTVATTGEGLDRLKDVALRQVPPPPQPDFKLSDLMEEACGMLMEHLRGPAARFWAIRHLEGDPIAADRMPLPAEALHSARAKLGLEGHNPVLSTRMARELRDRARQILGDAYIEEGGVASRLRGRLDSLFTNPWTGFPILGLVLYLGLYQFVGVFGGGFLVDKIEGGLFEGILNPFLEEFFARSVPWHWNHGLFVGEYGMLTLGIRYAVAIILPIVGTFFLAFSILEDSEYLPRLAMLLDRIFKRLGLNGRAVIPLVLGFGCATMATIVTRVLEKPRERIIATFLLAFAIPCSAQLGVLLGILSENHTVLLLWMGVVLSSFLLAGTLLARFLPGNPPHFFLELPPLRFPSMKNVATKTWNRMRWYFWEVIPVFLAASALLWLGEITGVFGGILAVMEPAMAGLGLPAEAAEIFLFGFFRRDYGAAGLYDLIREGKLTGVQVLVSAVTLTLFLPCIAQFLVMLRERGWKVSCVMAGAIFASAYGVGCALNAVLRGMGVVF